MISDPTFVFAAWGITVPLSYNPDEEKPVPSCSMALDRWPLQCWGMQLRPRKDACTNLLYGNGSSPYQPAHYFTRPLTPCRYGLICMHGPLPKHVCMALSQSECHRASTSGYCRKGASSFGDGSQGRLARGQRGTGLSRQGFAIEAQIPVWLRSPRWRFMILVFWCDFKQDQLALANRSPLPLSRPSRHKPLNPGLRTLKP